MYRLFLYKHWFFPNFELKDFPEYTVTPCTICSKSFVVVPGLSSLGVPWHTQILLDQLTLFQSRGTDYAHLITSGTPGFSDLPTALESRCLLHVAA